ncbi:MAG: reverse transcriptase/maturase family protein [Planctomycetota bacterium]
MKRTRVSLSDVADWNRLARATWRAARGKRSRPEVGRFLQDAQQQWSQLSEDVRGESYVPGALHRFTIWDPKRRTVSAPPFRDRVLHHSLMECLEPRLEQGLNDDAFACRRGRGTFAAIKQAQRYVQLYPWCLRLDVREFFDSIVHETLLAALDRRFKGPGVQRLVETIIRSHGAAHGRGLPIGTLTSQHFANTYLAPLERWLRNDAGSRGVVRYMDDTVAWFTDKCAARDARDSVGTMLEGTLGLRLRLASVQRSEEGVPLCGFVVCRGRLRLSPRRKRRYRDARRRLEVAFAHGELDALDLQRGYEAVLATTAHADARGWRRAEVRRNPPPRV